MQWQNAVRIEYAVALCLGSICYCGGCAQTPERHLRVPTAWFIMEYGESIAVGKQYHLRCYPAYKIKIVRYDQEVGECEVEATVPGQVPLREVVRFTGGVASHRATLARAGEMGFPLTYLTASDRAGEVEIAIMAHGMMGDGWSEVADYSLEEDMPGT